MAIDGTSDDKSEDRRSAPELAKFTFTSCYSCFCHESERVIE